MKDLNQRIARIEDVLEVSEEENLKRAEIKDPEVRELVNSLAVANISIESILKEIHAGRSAMTSGIQKAK